MNHVVVFSPNRYSLYSIAVTELLLRNQVQVDAIVVRKVTSWRRFISEYRRDGNILLRKIWKKLVLRKSAYHNRSFETIVDLMAAEGITKRKLDEFESSHNIPVVFFQDLNAAGVIHLLRDTKPDLVVFTGGGLIREEVLQLAGAGILNCHSGLLPRYRGMDAIEWPILEGRYDHLGLTVHFMEREVDTGDILRVQQVKLEPGDRLDTIRDRYEPIMSRLLVNTCVEYLAGRIHPVPQDTKEGRQYYRMHPRLLQIVEKRLDAYLSAPKTQLSLPKQ